MSIYVGPDELADIRKKRIVDCIKHRAVRDGKSVMKENATLSVAVFSVSEGYVNSSH